MHRLGADTNAGLVKEVAETIGDDFFLAITNHPLNEMHVDNRAMEAAVASLGSKARLFPSRRPSGASITEMLLRIADGLIVYDSKIFSLAGYHGVELLRRSRFETGDWLNAYTEFEDFLPAIADKRARTPDRGEARTWLAHHIANDVIDPVDPRRWNHGFAHYFETAQGVAA